MKLHSFVGLLLVTILHSCAENRVNEVSTGGETIERQEYSKKRPVPTFFGSDGTVRKVSPAAILDEVKRCLPPGIPAPVAWPELSNSMEVTNDGRGEEAPENKKRVMRSNPPKNISWITSSSEPSERTVNVQMEEPVDLPSGERVPMIKLDAVLKNFIMRHLRKNSTLMHKPRSKSRPNRSKIQDEYDDYDYDMPDENPVAERSDANGRLSSLKGHRFPRNRSPSQLSEEPDYDYDYSEGAKRKSHRLGQSRKSRNTFKAWPMPSELLKKRLILDDIQHHGRDDRDEPPTSDGEYRRMLEDVISLNSELVKLLEKTIHAKESTAPDDVCKEGCVGSSSTNPVIWDFIDFLVHRQQSKPDGGHSNDKQRFQQSENSDRARRRPSDSLNMSDVELLKRLMKWYLNRSVTK